MNIEANIDIIKAELGDAIAMNVMLKQDIEHLKLAVKELTHGQRSLNDSISGNAKLIANEAEARSHALSALQFAINKLSSQ